jgi:hypothetical protein
VAKHPMEDALANAESYVAKYRIDLRSLAGKLARLSPHLRSAQ